MTAENDAHARSAVSVTGALDAMRAELEHRPRDPFEVNRQQAAEALAATWGETYAITATESGFAAVRRHGRRVTLQAGTPDELVREMTEDSAGGA
jgi:hypothetical protein